MKWLTEIVKQIAEKLSALCNKTTIRNRSDNSFCLKEEISACNKNSRKQTSVHDRRKNTRYIDGRAIFCVPKAGFPFNAQVLDSSIGGLRIRTQQILETETVIGVIPNSRGASGQFLAKVMWQAKRNGINEYGVEFSQSDVNNMKKIGQFISPLKMKLQAN